MIKIIFFKTLCPPPQVLPNSEDSESPNSYIWTGASFKSYLEWYFFPDALLDFFIAFYFQDKQDVICIRDIHF